MSIFWKKVIVFVSVAVPLLVAIVFNISPPEIESDFNWKLLPTFHACLNGGVFLLLLTSFYFIKNGKVKAHQACNITALIFSATFLVSYVIYHTMTESTKHGGEGFIKLLYLVILGSHIALSTIILPLVLFTFLRAFTGDYERHRALAKWTMPIWLYVSATGVIVYLMISPYY